MATNPKITQGTLNRIRASVIVPAYTTLNIAPSYMGKNFVSVNFQGSFDQLIETGTGAVQSPEPYVLADINVDLLRTQSLSASWLAQAQSDSNLGEVTVYPDSSAFPQLNFHSVIITDIIPGTFDGQDPIVRLSMRGVFYINNNLWSF